MATVRMGRYELSEYDLPRVCICCGARATMFKQKRFQWHPPWAFLALGAMGAMMFAKTATLQVPLCERHKWHWGGRTAVILLSLLALLLLLFGAIVIASKLQVEPEFVFIPFAALFLAWLGLAITLSVTTVRPTEITDKSITLQGVSEEFIDALNEARRGDDRYRPRRRSQDDDDEDEDEDRPRRRRSRDDADDDDDDQPRSRRRVADDDGDDGGYYDPERRRRRPRSDD
jgi:hypothetical protein